MHFKINVTTVQIRLDPVHLTQPKCLGYLKKEKTFKVFDASGQNMTLRLEDESFLALLLLFSAFSHKFIVISFKGQWLCLNVESILSEQMVHNLLYRSVCQSCPLRSSVSSFLYLRVLLSSDNLKFHFLKPECLPETIFYLLTTPGIWRHCNLYLSSWNRTQSIQVLKWYFAFSWNKRETSTTIITHNHLCIPMIRKVKDALAPLTYSVMTRYM